jgi:N-acetylglutamate synthase-like GNAT family acetyltransferase
MIRIREFELADTEGVVNVILPIQQSEFDIPITLDAQPDLQNIPAFYQQGHGNFWIALDVETVVGTIALLDIGNAQVALRKMFVAAEYRGGEHAIATRLLERSLDWCLDRGVTDVFLGTTAKFLAAHRFYEKNGFTEIPKQALPQSFPVMAVDTKFYHRRS